MRGIRLFRLFGIDVYLSYLWFIVAIYEIGGVNGATNRYSSLAWNIIEYLTLFGIVLTHEFGHALACKSVGGEANRIMLWPLGGVAYVSPPMRPGAVLWSIVAGPLVNVVLAPVTIGAYLFAKSAGVSHDLQQYLWWTSAVNIFLFAFNMLPIYPLDGGKILWALLWFGLGRGTSLMVSCIIGLVGGGVALVLAAISGNIWFVALALYALFQSWMGLQSAKRVNRMAELPRRMNVQCPSCRESPPIGPLWMCRCGTRFDTFEQRATCPACGTRFDRTQCLHCGVATPFHLWLGVETIPMPMPTVMAPPPLPVQPPMSSAPPWP